MREIKVNARRGPTIPSLPDDAQHGRHHHGADPATSVVNRYLQSWQVPNLFVMGAGVFPHNVRYNPTDTVCRAAYWAADAIRTRYIADPTRGAVVSGHLLRHLLLFLGLLALAVARPRPGHRTIPSRRGGARPLPHCRLQLPGLPHGGPGEPSRVPAVETPFGVIYTPNITFEPETGLGRWSKDDFWRAMHEGIRRDGARLYPAFPYPHFTKMPREDVDAVYDYLSTIERVKKEKPPNELPYPLNIRRAVMAGTLSSSPSSSSRPPNRLHGTAAPTRRRPRHSSVCHTRRTSSAAPTRKTGT